MVSPSFARMSGNGQKEVEGDRASCVRVLQTNGRIETELRELLVNWYRSPLNFPLTSALRKWPFLIAIFNRFSCYLSFCYISLDFG